MLLGHNCRQLGGIPHAWAVKRSLSALGKLAGQWNGKGREVKGGMGALGAVRGRRAGPSASDLCLTLFQHPPFVFLDLLQFRDWHRSEDAHWRKYVSFPPP